MKIRKLYGVWQVDNITAFFGGRKGDINSSIICSINKRSKINVGRN